MALSRLSTIILLVPLGFFGMPSGQSRAGQPARAEKQMTQKAKSRSEIPEAYKWNLADLYASRADWDRDLKKLKGELKKLDECRGRLGRSAKQLGDCLDRLSDLGKRLHRLSGYAMRLHDQDAKQVEGQALKDLIQKTATEVGAKLAFVEPEILRIPPARLKTFLKSGRLRDHRHFIDNITRRRHHILSPAEEEIIARAGDLAAVPNNVYQTLSTVNLPWPEVTLKSGEKVVLNQAMYARLRGAPDRDDRLKVFQAFWSTFKKFRETYAALLSGGVNRDHYYAQVRKYKSDLQASLDESNVPVAIYQNMIKQVRAGLPQLWRYLKLRKKLLGLKELGYHDLYASIIPSVNMKFTYDQAKQIVVDACAPLGPDYTGVLKNAFEQRWADVYPTENKRNGAYMSGSAYDVHPYVLLNYNDDYNSMSTMAHEFGHAMHSYLSNKTQPFCMSDYPTFVAEVASTVNENLLRMYLSEKESDPKKKMFLLGQDLENFRTTVFRQAMFAEFELRIHELAQQGASLTAERLDELYLQLLREYYGEKQGVIRIDPLYSAEWQYIPHFYYNFYMFQYTTSFIAATSISERIRANREKDRNAYLSMLKAGGSKYPVQLLKMAGEDMSGADPYRRAFKAMGRIMDQIETLAE